MNILSVLEFLLEVANVKTAPQMQRIYSQQSWANAYSWCAMPRAMGCALSHREMLCYHQPAPRHFRPSSILLHSSYPLVFLMRLEQSPLPGGAARCSSGMASVLELEGKGPELFVIDLACV